MSHDTTVNAVPEGTEKEEKLGFNKIHDFVKEQQILETISYLIKTAPGKLLLGVLGFVLVVLILSFTLSKLDSTPIKNTQPAYGKPNTDMAYQEMGHVNQNLLNINHALNNQLQQLSSELIALKTQVQQVAKSTDINEIKELVTNEDQKLTQQIDSLQGNMDAVKQSLQPHNYLDPKNLPFKVVSVDVWGGQPYASIELEGKQDLIGLNETRSGWTVSSIDFANRIAEFKNEKDKYIKIQLEN